ncbi:hypothetical protein [Escherichia coli]|uniref:hypothetical protein n=1 Tax=Escherichia coli TaxID=562 RepID=UPI000AEAD86C|nr:hypothetical protein [Escherichia coli]
MRDIATINAIRSVAAVAAQHAEILVPEWLPEGKRQATEWVCRNPTRADRHAGSFFVSLVDGCWHDFATGDSGGDLVRWGLICGMCVRLMPPVLWRTGWGCACPHWANLM